ncbi:MAG: bifunctional DNA primase/polymerase [Chloroflexi bacterium]|nr:bifunctional DNA primase/polymerase [Chloroflexota bacterium]
MTTHNTHTSTITSVQQLALFFYDLGLNVFPQPFGRKHGLPWQTLQYTRLHRSDPEAGLTAVSSGLTNLALMCGSTSRNLFVIDCETTAALTTHLQALRQRHIPLWVVQTARGGHIYLLCADGEVANIDSSILPDTEIRGSRGYVLTVGSVHPNGTVYRWLAREGNEPPTVSLKSIDWLQTHAGSPINLRLTKQPRQRAFAANPLSRRTQDYLENGHSIPQGSRNNRLFSAACDLLGNGWSPQQVENRLTPLALQSGLEARAIAATLRSAASRSRGPAKPHRHSQRTTTSADSQSSNEVWQLARTFAETHTWRGHTATTDKLVFIALSERARYANQNGVFRASLREIAELARKTLNPVKKALNRLKNAHLLHYAGRDKSSSATLWRFPNALLKEVQLKSDSLRSTPPWTSWSESLFNATDAAERGALGYNGLRVYETLLAQAAPLLPTPLSRLMGVPVHVVNYALARLKKYALVQREPQGWRALAADAAELDERVARPARKLGGAERRRARHASQRARYAGRIMLQARRWRFAADLVAQSRPLFLDMPADLDAFLHPATRASPPQKPPEARLASSELQLWRCPNCGQQHFADVPPQICAFCCDMTTWERVFLPPDDAPPQFVALLADLLIQFALHLGASLEYINIRGERCLYPRLE